MYILGMNYKHCFYALFMYLIIIILFYFIYDKEKEGDELLTLFVFIKKIKVRKNRRERSFIIIDNKKMKDAKEKLELNRGHRRKYE